MPVYNGARTLRQSVDSVLAQTFDDLELIICNDASTDETRKILKNIDDVRVRVVHNASNVGEGPARDRAIELARGMILAVIDGDDTWTPDRLETLLCEWDPSQKTMIFDDIMECHDTPSGMVPWHTLRGKYAFGSNGNARRAARPPAGAPKAGDSPYSTASMPVNRDSPRFRICGYSTGMSSPGGGGRWRGR